MAQEASPVYSFSPYVLDVADRSLKRDGVPIPLTPKQFDLLVALVQNAGRLVEKDALLKKVSGLGQNQTELPVAQFMTPRPESVSPDDTLDYVLHKMDGGGYRHLPVVKDGKPISVVSVRDMLRHLTRLCAEGNGK